MAQMSAVQICYRHLKQQEEMTSSSESGLELNAALTAMLAMSVPADPTNKHRAHKDLHHSGTWTREIWERREASCCVWLARSTTLAAAMIALAAAAGNSLVPGYSRGLAVMTERSKATIN